MKLKHKKVVTLAAALITFGTLAGGAKAATLYTSGVSSATSPPLGSRGSSPSPDEVQTVATVFTLDGKSNVNGFTAEAAYVGPTAPGPAAPTDDVFTVALYSDTGALTPGGIIGSTITPSNFTRVDTTVDFDGYDVYSFNLQLPTDITLDAGSYWISIIDSTPSDPDYRWSWVFSSSGVDDPRYASNATDQLSAYTYTANRSLIFTVEGSVVPEPPVSAVPEPSASLGLLALGAAGLLTRRRFKRAA